MTEGKATAHRLFALALPLALSLSWFARAVRAADSPTFTRDGEELTRRFPGATVDRLEGGAYAVTPPPFALPESVEDLRYHWRFSCAAYVFLPRSEGPMRGLFRVVVLRYQPEYRDQARRCACLIARLLLLHRNHFHRETTFPDQAEGADVFLAAEKPPGGSHLGGETWKNSVYVFGVGVEKRSALEWVRTVAHEWGHLTLPAARRFREPENDAAGYLGERLYLKWLRSGEPGRPAREPDDGTTVADLDLYYHRQINPLIEEYQDAGPGSSLLDGADTAAMDYYIGAVLATDNAFGSTVTGRALYNVLADRAREFLVALRKDVVESPKVAVTLPAWIPVRQGTYRVTSGKRASSDSLLRVGKTEWRFLRCEPDTSETILLTRAGASAP